MKSGNRPGRETGKASSTWARDTQELFYRSGNDDFVAAQVTPEPTFSVVEQTVLFPLTDYLRGAGHPMYDVSPDDQRFVMLRAKTTGRTEFILVQNFFTELRERLER